MPLIQVKLIDEVFAPEQKRKAIADLTRAIVSIRGKQPITLVVIEEEASEGAEVGVG
jgi:4-oxalocrotonate tautomerase family enzyme